MGCKRCGQPICRCVMGTGCYWKGWVHEATSLHGCGTGTTVSSQIAEPTDPPMPTQKPEGEVA